MSQFIEMFDFHDLNLNSPSNDFESLCYDDTSSATKIPAGDYLSSGKYAIYDQAQDNAIAGYTDSEQGLCNNYPAVLFGDHSRVIKYISEPFFIGADGVKIIRSKSDDLLPEFLYHDLKYHDIPNTGYNRHFKYVKMLSLTKASVDEQKMFLSIAHQADKSEFGGSKSQFIEMFGDKEQNAKNGVLGDFCALKAGKSVNADEIQSDSGDGNYPCYGGNGLRGYVTSYSHDGEYIIIGRQGALCGNVNIAQGRFYATEHAIVVSPKEDINCCWLYYALKEMHLNQYARGVAQPGLAVNQLERLPFGVPSLDRQSKFESIYQQADKSEFELKKSIEAIDAVIKSLINSEL